MDGLSNNTEVLFLLTTNRPEVIEGAIAARPGRVDQAIEFPLPDAACRRRLLALYGKGLQVSLQDEEQWIARIEGASPAFIQELMRKSAMIAAEQGSVIEGTLQVTDTCFDIALREMVYGGGALTRNLLGFSTEGNSEKDA
jgi:ATP-dependent 26S proteasome regulatory subunit